MASSTFGRKEAGGRSIKYRSGFGTDWRDHCRGINAVALTQVEALGQHLPIDLGLGHGIMRLDSDGLEPWLTRSSLHVATPSSSWSRNDWAINATNSWRPYLDDLREMIPLPMGPRSGRRSV
jgi:hypothetical protein